MTLALWKYISQNWPVTYVFHPQGIFVWDPFMLYERKETEDSYDWADIRQVKIEEEHSKITFVFKNSLFTDQHLDNVDVDSLCRWLDQQGIYYSRFESINDGKVRKAKFQVN